MEYSFKEKITHSQYLNFIKEQKNLSYMQEEEWGQQGVTIYSETFYQKHIHNDVQYNMEQESTEKKVKNEKEEKTEKAKNKIVNQLSFPKSHLSRHIVRRLGTFSILTASRRCFG